MAVVGLKKDFSEQYIVSKPCGRGLKPCGRGLTDLNHSGRGLNLFS